MADERAAARMGDDEFLRHVPLFADLSDEQRGRVLAAAEMVVVPAGGWLFREGDAGDALFIVRHGRLEVVRDDVVIRVLGSGAALGELALLTEGDRSASVRARRETEVLRVGRQQFADLLSGDPAFAIALTRTLGAQLQRTAVAAAPVSRSSQVVTVIALQPHMRDMAARIAREFVGALPGDGGSVELLWGSEVASGEYGRVLDQCECEYDHVVLAADDAPDGLWDDFCLRQADRVVGVADPAAGPPSAEAAAAGVTDLVVVTRVMRAHTLGPWLDALMPEAQHHVDPADARFEADVARMARRLAGRAVGLVLSGGGARGMAHIGVLAALAEAGIEVDRLGGTSMGSFVAALAALGLTPSEMMAVAREELVARKPFNDYTVPRHSLIKARKAESMLMRVFGERRVEEMTRPFFAVSADLLSGEEVVLRRGPVAVAVGVSMCLPGLVPPVVAGDRLLVDGGVLNNLPVDVMADAAEGPIIAVDVMRRPAPKTDKPVRVRARARRSRPSPFGIFSPDDQLPSLVDTLARSTVLGSWRRGEANRARAAVVIAPDLVDVGLLEFRRLESIVERGRAAAEKALADSAALGRNWRT